MNLGFFTEGIQISLRKAVAITTLASSSIALFFLIPWVGADKILFYGFGALSAIVGSVVTEKIGRKKLFWSWIILGILSTLFLAIVAQGTIPFNILSILLGISFGFGIAGCFAFLANNTAIEERSRVFGVVFLETFIMVIVVMLIAQIFDLGLNQRIILIAITRSFGLLALIAPQSPMRPLKDDNNLSNGAFKNFGLYLLPWIFFNIACGLGYWWSGPPEPGIKVLPQIAVFYVCIAISAVLSGVVADRFGRKPSIAIGIVLAGIGFAIIGYYLSPLSIIVVNLALGIAWGFLFDVYLAIPGDIPFSFSKEKAYALGTIIPVILFLVTAAVPRTIFDFDITKLSPILSILFFLAVIPILFVRETLPENKIYKRKMKEHIDRLGKLLQESK